MIRMLSMKGRYSPIIVCDVCQRRITDAKMAMEIADHSHDEGDGHEVSVFHVHKGDCDRTLDEKLGAAGTNELSLHLYQLIRNVGLTLDDMRRQEEIQGMMDQL